MLADVRHFCRFSTVIGEGNERFSVPMKFMSELMSPGSGIFGGFSSVIVCGQRVVLEFL